MTPFKDYAPSAESPPPSESVRQGFGARFQRLRKSIGHFVWSMGWPSNQRHLAQEQAAGKIAFLMLQQKALLIEKEILAAERAKAAKARKRVSHFDARLRTINAELLGIGGNP